MRLLAILLTVLFIGLQLGHLIAWPWWCCISPLLVWLIAKALFFGWVVSMCVLAEIVKHNAPR